MKTLYAHIEQQGRVVLKNSEVGEPGPHEILLQAQFSTLSPGTESALLAGHILPLPQDIGYSLAAKVLAVGNAVDSYQPGNRVVATAKHASVQIVDERLVTPVPDGVDLEQAAFFNLAHTAMYGIRRTGLEIGEPALIMGQGLVGALTAQLARAAGAAPVIVTDIDDTRLETAKALGAHLCINPDKDPRGLDNALSGLGLSGFPVIFEATGSRQPLEQAVELLTERGRIMMLSQAHGDASMSIMQGLMMKGATLIGGYVNSKPFALNRTDLTITDRWPPVPAQGSQRYANRDCWSSDEDIRAVLNLMRFGCVDLSPLISHRFSVAQIPEAYELVQSGDSSLLGGVIHWQD